MGARSSKNTTQNNRSDGHLLEYFRNTFVRGGGAFIDTNSILNISTVSSTIVSSGDYTYVVWTGPGSFTVNSITQSNQLIPNATIDYLLVGGGGGGGKYAPYTDGTAGNPSIALGLTAYGGGFGAAYQTQGGYGGSGGGAGGSGPSGGLGNRVTGPGPAVPASIPAPLTPQGNNGGDAPATYGAGGGGGAGGTGGNGPTNSTWGKGGIGRASFNGDTSFPPSYGTPGPTAGRWFAGGGSGSGGNPAGGTPAPDAGGGGAGVGPDRNAIANTGGGGGTSTSPTGGGSGGGGAGGFLSSSISITPGTYPISVGAGGDAPGSGAGGSGIFVIRIPKSSVVS
jgi:hypothetical protein